MAKHFFMFSFFLLFIFTYLLIFFLLFFTLDKNGTFNENSIGFDGTLQRTDMENFGVFGSEKETVILSEIEKFRIRQGIRDK